MKVEGIEKRIVSKYPEEMKVKGMGKRNETKYPEKMKGEAI